MANYAIILAAGDGKRLGSKTPKCFIKINKKPIYQYSLNLFTSFKQIKQVVLVVPKQYLSKIKPSKNVKIVAGGKTRNQSFEKGIKAIKNIKKNDKVIIHDAARINLFKSDIKKVVDSKLKFGTLCYIGSKNNRDLRIGKYNIQTPQFCLFDIYQKAHKNPKGRDLFTYLDLKPGRNNFIISKSKSKNIKITFRQDLKLV